jgi:predicted transcriptional regulator
MSAAELKELRQEVKKYVDHADENVVRMMYAMLETNAEASLWEDMPDEIKAELEESLAQSGKGQTMTHEQVKKKYPQWFTK